MVCGTGTVWWSGEDRPDQVLVAAVMRLASRERPLPLLRMPRRARAQLPSTVDLRAVVIGAGPQRAAMERYLRRHRMSGWVELSGRLPRHRIAQVFERTDVFMAPAVLAAGSRLSPPDLGRASVLRRTSAAYASAELLARPATRPPVLGVTG
jgi:hypothetical protein